MKRKLRWCSECSHHRTFQKERIGACFLKGNQKSVIKEVISFLIHIFKSCFDRAMNELYFSFPTHSSHLPDKVGWREKNDVWMEKEKRSSPCYYFLLRFCCCWWWWFEDEKMERIERHGGDGKMCEHGFALCNSSSYSSSIPLLFVVHVNEPTFCFNTSFMKRAKTLLIYEVQDHFYKYII